jgi:hypothetical protein
MQLLEQKLRKKRKQEGIGEIFPGILGERHSDDSLSDV